MTVPDRLDFATGGQPSTPMIQTKDSPLAIVSMIAGIAGWVLLPVIGAVAAIVTGHLAKKEINEGAGLITGNGMATTGLILGYIQLGFVVLSIIAIILLTLFAPAVSEIFSDISM